MPAPSARAQGASARSLAAAFLLAYKRRDEGAMQSILENVGGDAMFLCTGLAAVAQTMIAQTVGLPLWQEFLESTLSASGDSPTDPTTAGRGRGHD